MTHRWLALVVGSVLLVELVTGTVLLFRPEIVRLSSPQLFAATPSAQPLDAGGAQAVVARERPGYPVGDTVPVDGVWQVSTTDYHHAAYVDAGSGRILGEAETTGGFIGLLLNVHDCFLACEGYTGYVPALAATVPGLGELTWANLVLGIVGLGFAVLAVSGVIAWWPSMRRFVKDLRRSLTVHLRRGQYRFNRDLHDVCALVALPLLVVWAVTGAGYGMPFVGDAWYALTGGEEQAEASFTPDAMPPDAADIGTAGAVASARALLGGQELTDVIPPSADLGGYYQVGLQSGIAPARYGGPRLFSETTVDVDPHTGRAEIASGGPEQSWSSWAWTSGNYGVHFGYMVPWWARLVWFAAGLVSIYLVGSGFWTWWWRRRQVRLRRS
ncbi:PepSY-associated TM helix domain-containing protein [Actinomycetospora sp.]|uniref:PepSY-associated TM helix domain-containing protein n=1 Tax=Actinomycetospora sp. TaxID=1872135 RepID=UPI002F400538